ncbi:protein GL2-INTERACTING REPRESSOR 1-like [Diospyros lotus]|uniref:protein GL2-INTERACTING REPRESSOR 1-like n=1 Tax=Diospyros lotus TaxID=55363 RepID=UPI00225B5DE3|nr:protein GL2-INTERACTING REPRESSOR 1-like [Diospyros lotus]
MSRRNGPKLELKLNLSPPRVNPRMESPSRSATVSPQSSCVSSEHSPEDSPEATSMLLAGCPRCLMYVMLTEAEPRCPKCKSTVLLDIGYDNGASTSPAASRKTRKN